MQQHGKHALQKWARKVASTESDAVQRSTIKVDQGRKKKEKSCFEFIRKRSVIFIMRCKTQISTSSIAFFFLGSSWQFFFWYRGQQVKDYIYTELCVCTIRKRKKKKNRWASAIQIRLYNIGDKAGNTRMRSSKPRQPHKQKRNASFSEREDMKGEKRYEP